MVKHLPVRPKQKIVDVLPISVDVLVFGWNTRKIQNLETEEVFTADAWTFLNGSANLNNAIRTGVRGKDGKKLYGFDAVADRLSALGVPITPEECKELIQQAVSQRIAFAKLMRKSDWTTSPELYDGKNEWQLISDISNIRDEMDRLLDAELRKSGLRLYNEANPKR